MKNQSINGFVLPFYKELHPKYINQLIGDVLSNKKRVVLDLGHNTNEGPFNGIESVVRGVEVLIQFIDNFCIKLNFSHKWTAFAQL